MEDQYQKFEKYDFLKPEWDGVPHTVWSRKKQAKIVKYILKKYPNPESLKQKLLSSPNVHVRSMGRYINTNWTQNHYQKFISANIIKYSDFGKIMISQIAGTGLGTLAWWGTGKYWEGKKNEYLSDTTKNIDYDLKHNISREELGKKYTSDDFVNAGHEFNYLNTKLPNQNIIKFSPVLSSLTAKGLGTYGTYKFLNAIDK